MILWPEPQTIREAAMGQALALRQDFTAHDLRREARISKDGDQVRWLLAIAMIYDGASRAEAAQHANADVQTLRDWVIRFNAEGIDGLKRRPHPGRPPKLAPDKQAKLAAIVLMGPCEDWDEVVRYRLVDIKKMTREHFNVDVCENTISSYLKRNDLSHMTARPQHPQQEAHVIEAFKKTPGTDSRDRRRLAGGDADRAVGAG
jgi:transposase